MSSHLTGPSHQVNLSVASLENVNLDEDIFVVSPRSERREEEAEKQSSASQTYRRPTTQREIFDFVIDECLPVNRAETKPLSLTKRAMIQVVHYSNAPPGNRFILRVSVHNGDSKSPIWTAAGASQRIKTFGTYWMEHQREISGLVPILSAPQTIDTIAGSLMIEKYAEIVYNPMSHARMDLLGLCSADTKSLNKPLGFIYDVAVTLAGLHAHGWCHMDVSLENVALSQTQAYLIDFESCLPFSKSGFVRRASIKVPLKLPFVPPEHFVAKRSHYISLRAYDVWGWGLLLFEAIFQCYLFDLVAPSGEGNGNGGQTYSPHMGQVEYFCGHGFKAFIREHHPAVFAELYGVRAKAWLIQVRDLFEKVFVMPVEHTSRSSGAVRWKDDHRITCAEVVSHPFWVMVGVSKRQQFQPRV